VRSVEQTPLPLYLRVEDRNAMAHSVEVRLPFLDHRLVSLVFHLPDDWKTSGVWNKYILREAMHNRIPESVRSRLDKMGFPVPAKKWFAGPLYDSVQDLLSSRELRQRGIYNVKEIRSDLELHREGKIDASNKLFDLVQFEFWCKLQRTKVAVGLVILGVGSALKEALDLLGAATGTCLASLPGQRADLLEIIRSMGSLSTAVSMMLS